MVDFDDREKSDADRIRKIQEMALKTFEKWNENESKLQERLENPPKAFCCEAREIYYHLDLHLTKDQMLKVIEALEPTEQKR